MRTLQRGHTVTPKVHRRDTRMSISHNNLNVTKIVEQTIKHSDIYPTKTALWKRMPIKITYRRFIQIVKQLERDNKLILDKDLVVWTLVENPQARRSLEQSVKLN